MRMLIGLDGSAEAAAGLDLVARLRLAPTDEMILASVVEVPTGVSALAGPPTALVWYEELRAAALDEARRIVDEAGERVTGPWTVDRVVEEGHPLDVLERLARDRAVDLVVVGPRGHGRLEALLVGSVSQGLLHARGISVLVTRPVRHELRTAVLAVDGSAAARAATQRLASLPLPGTSVVAVTVLPMWSGPYGRPWSDELFPVVEAQERAVANAALDEAVSVLRGAGTTATSEVRSGMAKREILEAAQEHAADLIVLGARGLGGFEELVLGSVSRAVSKAADCSVLVVDSGGR